MEPVSYHSSINLGQNGRKMLVLVTSELLEQFVNTLTADY